jgi:polysaccharide transporter, PST family
MTQTQKVFNGALITVAMRWSDRLIGLVSMIVLARLLVPADFGVIAMAALVVGFIDMLLDLGVSQALIHNDKAEKADFDTAWTLRLIQASLTGVFIIFAAPLGAIYFNNPDITDVLRVMAISVFIGGLENIGIVKFQKEMNFGRDFKFFFLKRVVGFTVTLIAAVLLHSYWAMVIGSLSGRVAGVILSYGMHPYRPWFSFSRIREIWSFSQWILFKNIGVYFDTSIDRLLLGHKFDATVLGGYTIAGEVSALPTTELLSPLGRVLFPAFVEKRNDAVAFANRISLAFGVQGLVAIPTCLGLMFVAHDVVFVLLGEKWLFIVPIIQILCVTHLIGTIAHSSGYALLALGKVKIQAVIIWIQFILFLLVFFIVATTDVEHFALIRLLVIAIGSVALISVMLRQVRALSAVALLFQLVRPALSAIAMMIMLNVLHPILIDLIPVIRLMFEIVLGGLVYVFFIGLMWHLMGRPEGAEAYLLKNILLKRD